MTALTRCALVLPALLFVAPPAVAEDDPHTADRAALLAGIDVLEPQGVPGTMCVFGDDAFVVLTGGKQPEPVVAAARAGKGRVVAIAHGGYLSRGAVSDPDRSTSKLFANAVRWAAGDRAGERVRVGVLGGDAAWEGALAELGHEAVTVDLGKPVRAEVLVWIRGVDTAEHERQVQKFVLDGGGLLAAHCPWGYEQVNERRGLTLRDDLPENHVLRPMGMVLAQGTAKHTGGGGYSVAKSQPLLAHAGLALTSVEKGEKDASARIHLLTKAVRSLPRDDGAFLPRIAKLVDGATTGARWPTPKTPLTESDALARLRVGWWIQRWLDVEPAERGAAPGIDAFLGAVPGDAKRVTRRLDLDPSVPGWHSTGLYVAPGETLQVVAGKGRDGWRVRVGCHKDRIWHKPKWKRWPEISISAPLKQKTTEVVSPFGGPVYIERAREDAPPLSVEIRGAVEAPWYVLGDANSAKRWKDVRTAPGPWAELEGRHIVLSVPSRVVRKWDDPAPLLAWWDSVIESHCRLAAIPIPSRKERFVPDVQISAGYMHSGYPIMMQLDQVRPKRGRALPPLLDLEVLEKDGTWGPYHELGHNRQRSAWTFGGTTEVTCNLFSLYSSEQVVGIEPWTHPWMHPKKKAGVQYLAQGAPFAQWKKSPGLALLTYGMLQKQFGWEPFITVFGEYEADGRASWPKKDADKIDGFVRRMSHACKHDLRPYFAKWRWPLGAALRADTKLGKLPVWEADFSVLGK